MVLAPIVTRGGHASAAREHRALEAPRSRATRSASRNLAPTALTLMVGECLRLPPDRRVDGDAIRDSPRNPSTHWTDRLAVVAMACCGWRQAAGDAERIHQHLTDAMFKRWSRSAWPRCRRHRAAVDTRACVGGQVTLARLAVAAGVNHALMEEQLVPALQDGLLVMDRASAAVQVRHDRILQSLVSRLDAAERAALQLDVARRLAASEHAGIGAEVYLQVWGCCRACECCAWWPYSAMPPRRRASPDWVQIERYAREGLCCWSAPVRHHPHSGMREDQLRLAADRCRAVWPRAPAGSRCVYAQIVANAPDPLHRAERAGRRSAASRSAKARRRCDLAWICARPGLDVPASPGVRSRYRQGHQGARYLVSVDIERCRAAECRDPRALAIARTLNRSIPGYTATPHHVVDDHGSRATVAHAGRRRRLIGP